MPPLAQRLAREATLPAKRRTFSSHRGPAPDLLAVPCFDISEVYDLAFQFASNVERIVDGPLTTFLPAQRVWIEWAQPRCRFGMLIEHTDQPSVVNVTEFLDNPSQGYFATWDTFTLGLSGEAQGLLSKDGEARDDGWSREGFSPQNLLPAILLIINSPKVIEREVVPRHRGLERDLRVAQPSDRRLKLLPWTKIRLSVLAAPARSEGGSGQCERLAGAKALHFCRSHLRIRLGRLEVVSAHWRGDAALGIRQSSYVVTKEGRVGSAP